MRPFLVEIDVEGADPPGVLLDQLAIAAIFEAGGVGHQVPDQDGTRIALVGDLILLGEVDVDASVQADVVGFDLAHERDPGEGLGHRAQPEQRPIRIHRARRAEPVGAIAFLQHDLAVLHDRHRGAGDVVGAHGLCGHAVHEGFQLTGRDRLSRWERQR